MINNENSQEIMENVYKKTFLGRGFHVFLGVEFLRANPGFLGFPKNAGQGGRTGS